MKRKTKLFYLALPVAGVLFYLIYLHMAAIDMVYSDYVRLINSYLPDVWNPDKFFVPDLLTRIPVNYLERGINVQIFGYSVTFDRVMGVLCFGLAALVIADYCRKRKVGAGWYLALMTVLFGLNKWEMVYNGTGWAHFLAFACFYYNYLVLDRIYSGHERRWDRLLLFVLPAIVTVGVAGPYCAVYSATLLLAYLFILVRGWIFRTPEVHKAETAKPEPRRPKSRTQILSGRELLAAAVCVAVPLFIYLWSNSMAVYEYSGAVEEPLLQAFFREPKFFLTFFLKSFSSMVFGVELINRQLPGVPDFVWCLLGVAVIAAYVLALWMNFYYRIAERTVFPLMLLAAGGMNHVLVLVTRWIFMPNNSYGMSSRYALQYQVGIIGIFLTFALAARLGEKRRSPGRYVRTAALAFSVLFAAGNLVTTAEEFAYAGHRKTHNLEVKEVLLRFEEESDETLNAALEYHKDGTREALTILKENGYNLFHNAKDLEEER